MFMQYGVLLCISLMLKRIPESCIFLMLRRIPDGKSIFSETLYFHCLRLKVGLQYSLSLN